MLHKNRMTERKAQLAFTQEDTVRATNLVAKKALPIPASAVLIAAFAVAAAALYMRGFGGGTLLNVLLLLLGVLVAGFVALQYVIMPRQAKQHYRQSASIKDDVTAEWDEDRIKLSCEHGSVDFAWSEFHQWTEDEELVLLYQTAAQVNGIPKRALSDWQYRDIVSHLETAKVKKR